MSRGRKSLFALLAVLLALGSAEAALRLAGFSYRRVTTDMEFTYPRPGFIKAFFEIDPDLLYRIRSTVKQRYVDLTWQPRFGLKIREARTFGPKPTGVARIIALGDSSTYGVNTRRPWPGRLQERLDRRAGAGRFEVLNLGVPGYTAFQGRKVLETRGERLQPDAVILYFGWNDHLLALGRPDSEQKVGGAAVVGLRNVLGESRVYQALSRAVAALRPAPGGAGPGEAGTRPGSGPAAASGTALRRVGPDAFRDELRRMVEISRRLGAMPLLCTYPTAFSALSDSGRPAPGWLVESHIGPTGSLDDVVRLQRLYNDIIRSTGHDLGVVVIDLAILFEARGKQSLFDAPDGDLIHPADAGYDLATEAIYEALRSSARP